MTWGRLEAGAGLGEENEGWGRDRGKALHRPLCLVCKCSLNSAFSEKKSFPAGHSLWSFLNSPSIITDPVNWITHDSVQLLSRV